MKSYLLALITAWRATTRAALSDDLLPFRADYERRARDYALAIRTNWRKHHG